MRSSDKPRCIYKVPAYDADGQSYRCHRTPEEGREYCKQHAKKVAKEAEGEISKRMKDSK